MHAVWAVAAGVAALAIIGWKTVTRARLKRHREQTGSAVGRASPVVWVLLVIAVGLVVGGAIAGARGR